jgi:Amt family ammonium transporter
MFNVKSRAGLLGLCLLAVPGVALADELNSVDTAWMIVATALVLFMTIPGLSLLWGTIPESVFVTFQMTFAIITPALMVGAFAERMKFSAMLIFMSLWLILC